MLQRLRVEQVMPSTTTNPFILTMATIRQVMAAFAEIRLHARQYTELIDARSTEEDRLP